MISQLPIVEIRHLNHYYGKGSLRKQILFDINLQLFSREIVIFTGPSGSGKTTLLTLLGGLRSVQEGSIKIFNKQLYGAKKKQFVQIRRQIGYIFQAHNLLEFLTARQNVQMSVELHKQTNGSNAAAKSAQMLKAVGLAQQIDYVG